MILCADDESIVHTVAVFAQLFTKEREEQRKQQVMLVGTQRQRLGYERCESMRRGRWRRAS